MQEPIPGAATSGAPPGFGPTGRLLLALSKALSMVGGLVFVALVVMSIVSIVGRKLASAPVPGDVEMLQMCAAFATACFFAYCHLVGGDVKVDFFTARCSDRARAWMDAAGSLLFGLVGAVLAWRSAVGALDMRESGETSVILGWPVWLAQMLMLPGLVLMAMAGLYMVGVHLRSPDTVMTGAVR
ncbi:TRAP transporter small permease subunit [Pseudaquabacterium rugosum]|uniref:TRAP transporter small permease protein n=1 Tax=Pseudaquabacterium rugosum TaxID=2984194 RepID=A0ABU9BF88_9BURK